MFTHRLDGDRCFGRVFELDLGCPQCGEVFHLNSPYRTVHQKPGRHTYERAVDQGRRRRFSPGPYNYRTGRFKCPSCELVLAVGLYLYPVDDRHGEDVAADWAPTYREAIALREQTVSMLAPIAVRWKMGRNTVVREGCCCRIHGGTKERTRETRTKFVMNKDCPIHGCLVNENGHHAEDAGDADSHAPEVKETTK